MQEVQGVFFKWRGAAYI